MDASTRKARTWLAAALWAGTLRGAAAAPVFQELPQISLEGYRQARQLEWDLRDDQDRVIQDPAVRAAMIQAELDAAYTAEFQRNDPTTDSLLAWLQGTVGASRIGNPSTPAQRGACAAISGRLEALSEPAMALASRDVPTLSSSEAAGGTPSADVFHLPLVLRC